MSCIVLILLYVFLFNISNILTEEIEQLNVVRLNYTEIAREMMENKNGVLDFLNKTHVKKKYKLLYNMLLDRLSGHKRSSIIREIIVDPTRRVVFGHNTSIESVPWQASIRHKSNPICGASILSQLWLITAAHCLKRYRLNNLSVRLGSSWRNKGGEMYDIAESVVNPLYNNVKKVNDVGLVKLYHELRFSSRVLPIRVIAKDDKIPSGKTAVVSGWGRTNECGTTATYLQSTKLKTIPMKLCKKSGLNKKAVDPATMFCAGSFMSNTADACNGDSGGPIVSEGVLIGIVSWGVGCARGNFPGVYTRLSNPQISDWINKQIRIKT